MTADADVVLVIDASAVVSIVASGAATVSSAVSRIDGATLHAPAIVSAEVDSALRGLSAGGRLTSAQADAARAMAHELPIELWPWALLTDRAWALRHNLSTHDAGYVALAERLGATLLTGDRCLAASTGARCEIEILG